MRFRKQILLVIPLCFGLTGCSSNIIDTAYANESSGYLLEAFDSKEVSAKSVSYYNSLDLEGPENSGILVNESVADSDSLTMSDSSGESESTSVSVSYVWPLSIKGVITSKFGRRASPTAGASSEHKGIDVGIAVGTKVLATASGTVVTARWQNASNHKEGAGLYIEIDHGNGMVSQYMHLNKLKVSVGDTVSSGDVIAYSGNTGVSTGPHLHFGMKKNGTFVNPLDYVKSN